MFVFILLICTVSSGVHFAWHSLKDTVEKVQGAISFCMLSVHRLFDVQKIALYCQITIKK